LRTYHTGDLDFGAGRVPDARRPSRLSGENRGFRIDLSEIEVAMHAIDGVKDAVVVGRQEAGEELRLIAYFVASTVPLRPRRTFAEAWLASCPNT
jgi:hypothetical protein